MVCCSRHRPILFIRPSRWDPTLSRLSEGLWWRCGLEVLGDLSLDSHGPSWVGSVLSVATSGISSGWRCILLESGVGAHLDTVAALGVAWALWGWVQGRGVVVGMGLGLGIILQLSQLSWSQALSVIGVSRGGQTFLCGDAWVRYSSGWGWHGGLTATLLKAGDLDRL